MHLRLLTALCNDTLEGANMRAELAGRVDHISALQSERHQMQLEVHVPLMLFVRSMQLEVHCASHTVCAVVPVQLEVHVPLVLFVLLSASYSFSHRQRCLVSIALSALPCQHCLFSIAFSALPCQHSYWTA